MKTYQSENSNSNIYGNSNNVCNDYKMYLPPW